jgi:hypothetical protein
MLYNHTSLSRSLEGGIHFPQITAASSYSGWVTGAGNALDYKPLAYNLQEVRARRREIRFKDIVFSLKYSMWISTQEAAS